jgi:hypothetical protein
VILNLARRLRTVLVEHEAKRGIAALAILCKGRDASMEHVTKA